MKHDFNELSKTIYEQNKAVGWWDDPNRCIYQTLQLVNTEIAEATEGARKDLMDDHLPHRKMEEVELADALIRMLDLGGRCGWAVLSDATQPHFEYESVGHAHLQLSQRVSALAHNLPRPNPYANGGDRVACYHYTMFLFEIVDYAESRGYDVMAALHEKLEYNKQRADHKRENRAKEHGKQF